MIRELTAEDVEFSLVAEAEDTPVRGNFASGDLAADRELENSILARLNGGSLWAWCCVKVTARWKSWTGVAYLGACSYKSEADFMKPGGYYDDMKASALEDLNKSIASCVKELSELVVAAYGAELRGYQPGKLLE